MVWSQRLEQAGIALAVVLLVLVPIALHGWPTTAEGNLFVLLLAGSGLALVGWRRHPRATAVTALGLEFAAGVVNGPYPDTAIGFFSAGFALLAVGWSGRAAWLVGLGAVGYDVAFYQLGVLGDAWVALLMLSVPPYLAGTVLRLRRETADQLARRVRELELERELYADIAVRHERARIAGELHDIVGHAISVMVIQAAAGQRLAETDPERARAAFAAISESARQGTTDLERLIELLSAPATPSRVGADLALVDEVVTRAGRSGLSVTCRFEGDRAEVSPQAAHLAFRVVQESLTNALRYAPGAEVRITMRVETADGRLAVRVENDRVARQDPALVGTGRGLLGLRERVQSLGGHFAAGATVGGWAVEARLPAR